MKRCFIYKMSVIYCFFLDNPKKKMLLDEDELQRSSDDMFKEQTSSNIQSNLDKFLSLEKSESNLKDLDVAKELRDIKSMLSHLNLSSKRLMNPKFDDNGNRNIKEADNLLELSLFEELNIVMKEDGCFIQCLTCKHYKQSSNSNTAS